MNFARKQIEYDSICKNHSARSDRELYRTCPSKLSKRELEELYFALVQNNLDLKKTVNGQQDRIKALSTKVQRITATQKTAQSKETRDCCIATKALVNEQKDSMAELKLTNERMAERIRLLNMRLCSAKQFLQCSPSKVNRCSKCSTAPPPSVKNSASSFLNAKCSYLKTEVSCQYIETDVDCPTTRSVEVETEHEEKKLKSDRVCDENRCRTLMEELKQKVTNLEKELSSSHSEYSSRITCLERAASVARAEHAAAEARLQQHSRLVADLRAAEANCNVLTTQLSIERRKVAELETRLKAANISSRVAQTIEDHLITVNNATGTPVNVDSSPAKLPVLDLTPDREAGKIPPSADDSGYMDSKSYHDKGIWKLNDDIMNKVADLETKLDNLKISTAAEISKNKAGENFADSESIMPGLVSDDSTSTINRVRKYDACVEPLKNDTPLAKNGEMANMAADFSKDTETYIKSSFRPVRDDWLATNEDNAERKKCENSTDIEKSEKRQQTLLNKDAAKETSKEPNTKANDQHNKLQIPGPIPARPNDAKREPKKLMTKQLSLHRKLTAKSKSKDETKKDDAADKIEGENFVEQVESEPVKDNKITSEPVSAKKDAHDKSTHFENEVDIDDSNLKAYPSRDSIPMYQERLCKSHNDEGKEMIDETGSVRETVVTTEPAWLMADDVSLDNIKAPIETSGAPLEDVVQCKVNVAIRNNSNQPVEFCESHSRICTCPVRPQKNVAVFRTCSGTLRFTTTDATPRFKSCKCGSGEYEPSELCSDTGNAATLESQLRSDRRLSTVSDQQTYTVSRPQLSKQEPPMSPDNTEHEISSLTDLPSEQDAKSPRSPRSPGEDKATTTYTESYTTPDVTDYGSLSEGELPPQTSVKRVSIGEQTGTDTIAQAKVSSTYNMESALRAISEELALCKKLLISQRPQETPKRESRDAATPTHDEPPPIALHRALANRSIAEAHVPKCVFTLHIGTIVLSDEAVLNSRDKTLVLMWKFYDQNLTMTRMHAGRVVLFDFATEYDVQITDEFLDYMKHDEMKLKVCEMTKQDQPIATCVLPLRDALLHTNRRVDMSLALLAGPLMRGVRGAEQLAGDEVGVLDLWCELRAEPALLPAINTVIARSSLAARLNTSVSPNIPNTSRILQQVVEDETSSGNRLSQDLDLCISRKSDSNPLAYNEAEVPRAVDAASQAARDYPPRQDTRSDRHQSKMSYDDNDMRPLAKMFSTTLPAVDEVPQLGPTGMGAGKALTMGTLDRDGHPRTDLHYDEHKYPMENRSSAASKQNNDSKIEPKPSGILINQVACKIKSSSDLRQALEENLNSDNESQHIGKLKPGKEPGGHSRLSSARNIFGKKWHRQSSATHKDLMQQPYDWMKENTAGYNPMKPDVINKKSVTISSRHSETFQKDKRDSFYGQQYVDITILWLALNEECEAMIDPRVQRLYVAYSFLGRSGAELETPISLPKPKHYVDKCCFNFTKRFNLDESDLPMLGHMARCRSVSKPGDPRDCIQFCVVSEPLEDPLGLDSCEDIGYAYLFLGDLIAYSADSPGYTEVIPVRAARGGAPVCGVLAVRVDGLDVLRTCLRLSRASAELRSS